MLPVGCGQYLFAAGVRLPLLKQLMLGAPMEPIKQELLYQATTGRYWFFSESHWGFGSLDACFGPGDVAPLVCCCPALELLSIPGLVQLGVDMGPLLGLWQLRELYVGGEAVDDGVAGSVLAHMVRLRQLEVAGAPHLTDAGVLALAGNKGLRELLLVECGLGDSMPITPCGGEGGACCLLVQQQVRYVWVHTVCQGWELCACHAQCVILCAVLPPVSYRALSFLIRRNTVFTCC
jgi:hypothetical protein